MICLSRTGKLNGAIRAGGFFSINRRTQFRTTLQEGSQFGDDYMGNRIALSNAFGALAKKRIDIKKKFARRAAHHANGLDQIVLFAVLGIHHQRLFACR